MAEENNLDQIRLRKTQVMLAQARNSGHASNQPMTVTDDSFHKAVQTHDLLVVDFWAPWCGPCRMVGPIIEALSAEYTGEATFGKMNVDENQVVPSSFGIMSIPTIIIFSQGKEVERLVGAYPKVHIEAMIKRYLR
ncbi:MAG: thioredoxin [Candidatus Bathyarchaeia archaeon]